MERKTERDETKPILPMDEINEQKELVTIVMYIHKFKRMKEPKDPRIHT